MTTNVLNAWATHIQERWYGKIYDWDLEMIEKIY